MAELHPRARSGLATDEMIQAGLKATQSIALALSLDEMTLLLNEPAHVVFVREVLDALHPDYAVLKLPKPNGTDNEGDPLWRVGPFSEVVIAYCDTDGDPMLRLPNGEDEPARWVERYAAVLAAGVRASRQLAAAFAERVETAAAIDDLVDQGLVEIVEDGEARG